MLVAGPAGLLGAALAGCTADRKPDGAPAPTTSPDPDDALREAAAERERGLLREYDATLAALPALAPRLAPLRAHHDEHLAALLGPAASAEPSTGATPGARATAGPAPSPTAVPPPADARAALARLVAAERAAAAAHAQDCLTASRALAGVLAALSASELSHPVALA